MKSPTKVLLDVSAKRRVVSKASVAATCCAVLITRSYLSVSRWLFSLSYSGPYLLQY